MAARESSGDHVGLDSLEFDSFSCQSALPHFVWSISASSYTSTCPCPPSLVLILYTCVYSLHVKMSPLLLRLPVLCPISKGKLLAEREEAVGQLEPPMEVRAHVIQVMKLALDQLHHALNRCRQSQKRHTLV